jgi:prevent-host-death family protein
MAMKRVGVAELKNNLSRHLRAVEAGETLEVTDHDRPIARVLPAAAQTGLLIQPPKRPFAEVRDEVYDRLELSFDPLELLLRDRAKR